MKSSVTERPAPANAGPARTRRTELYLLSSDDELLLELGPLLGERYRVRTIDEPSELPVEEGRACLLILDSTRRPDALEVVTQIEKQYPSSALIALIGADASSQWSALVSRGVVCAAVPRAELSSGTFSEALQRAEARLADQSSRCRVPQVLPGSAGDSFAAGDRRGAHLETVAASSCRWHRRRHGKSHRSHAGCGTRAGPFHTRAALGGPRRVS
jgi:hypothetical protein